MERNVYCADDEAVADDPIGEADHARNHPKEDKRIAAAE
jgi:hypothetical protein